MVKKEKDVMLFPPDGGEWTVNMKSGATHYGLLMHRYDNGFILDAGNGIYAHIVNDAVESMWENLARPDGYKTTEA